MPQPRTAAIISASLLSLLSLVSWACHSKNEAPAPKAPAPKTEIIAPAPELPSPINPASERWADSVMATLSPRQRAAQLFVPRLDITNNAAGYATLKRIVGDQGMGGILLGKGTVEGYADIINHAQSYAAVPMLATLDGEWGLSMRVTDAPRFPHNIAIGAANDPELTRAYGREVARQCRLTGIQVDFAPVLDVNSNPDNPVIGFRSFGEDPELVGRLGAAFCAGMQSEGVMAVGKHFPGHGDTSVDSHKALPTVSHSLPVLKSIDFKPFEMAMRAGMEGVMVGHLKVPALDASGTPSSLSKIITTDCLQDSLGFKGLIFTDALAMKGAARTGENNCVSALLAGADILLNSSSPVADLNAVMSAVESGKLSQQLIDERCRKLLIYKHRLGLANFRPADTKGLATQLDSKESKRIIAELSRKAITVVKNNDAALPLSGKRIVVVSIGAKAENSFAKECKTIDPAVTTFSYDGASPLPAAVSAAVKNADEVVIAVFKDSAASRTAFSKIADMRPAIGVFILNPFRVPGFKDLNSLKATVLAYDNIPQLSVAAARTIFGKEKVSGHLPVNLPGVGRVGDGLTF